jgi:hypothetical protein
MLTAGQSEASSADVVRQTPVCLCTCPGYYRPWGTNSILKRLSGVKSVSVHFVDTGPTQAYYPAIYFRQNWTEPSDYSRKSNAGEDISDTQVRAFTLLFPDSRNLSSCNIQLLFLHFVFRTTCLHFDVLCWNCVGIATRGAMREASSSPLRNLHNQPGDKLYALLHAQRSTRPHQPLNSTAITGILFSLAFSPCQFTVGRTKHKAFYCMHEADNVKHFRAINC